MQRFFLLLFFFSGFISIVFSQEKSGYKGSQYCSQKKSQSRVVPDRCTAVDNVPTHSYDVLKYNLDLNLYSCYSGTCPNSFTGSVIITFRVNTNLNSIQLNAEGYSMVIDSVRMAGISFSHSNDILTIQLNRTYSQGEIAEVKIIYRHKDVQDNGFYAKDGFAFTDAEPEGARKWFPCWDQPSDKAKFELTAKVPLSVKLGSNGLLADSVISGDTIRYHWVSLQDVATYLMVISSRVNYNLDIVYWHKPSNPADSIPIRFYFNDGEDPGTAEAIIRDMTDWFSEKFCEHPFDKNGFATLNDEFSWGGMENQTLTSLCPDCWGESLIAHEFAHQWYGDMITCGTWADIWLNEGFATWAEAFWYESSGGYAAYKQDIGYNAQSYLNGNPGWPISIPSWATHTPTSDTLFNWEITYCKGACVLHQLRYVLGDSLFFSTLQTYCADTNLKFKSAVIPDFMAIVNEVTGNNYDWFFNEWIYQPNHPYYQNTFDFENLVGGEWKVNLFLTQVQTNAPFFSMPVQIQIKFADNSDTTLLIMNDTNYQRFNWTFSRQPVDLIFDPGDNIVLKQGSTIVGFTGNQSVSPKVNLSQNIPNPAVRSTRIVFEIGGSMPVTLEVKNLMGEVVMTPVKSYKDAGKHFVDLDCSTLSQGVYTYRLNAGGHIQTRKLVVTK